MANNTDTVTTPFSPYSRNKPIFPPLTETQKRKCHEIISATYGGNKEMTDHVINLLNELPNELKELLGETVIGDQLGDIGYRLLFDPTDTLIKLQKAGRPVENIEKQLVIKFREALNATNANYDALAYLRNAIKETILKKALRNPVRTRRSELTITVREQFGALRRTHKL